MHKKKKSGQNICVAVARAGNAKACTYNGNCRYSHDLEGFLAQKPADLPGQCPFLHKAEPCRYGVACRFAGTHVEHNSPREETLINDTSYEMNGLDKDLQKLIWKNAVTFPKADAQLKEIGILGKGKPKPTKICEEQYVASNKGSEDNLHVVPSVEIRDTDSDAVTDKDNLLGFSSKEHDKGNEQIDDIPHPKKSRIADDRNDYKEICDGQITNGNRQHSGG